MDVPVLGVRHIYNSVQQYLRLVPPVAESMASVMELAVSRIVIL